MASINLTELCNGCATCRAEAAAPALNNIDGLNNSRSCTLGAKAATHKPHPMHVLQESLGAFRGLIALLVPQSVPCSGEDQSRRRALLYLSKSKVSGPKSLVDTRHICAFAHNRVVEISHGMKGISLHLVCITTAVSTLTYTY